MDQPAIRVSIFHFFPNTNNNYYYYLYFGDLQNFNIVLASCFPRWPHPMIPTNTGSLFGISCNSLDDWGFNENSIYYHKTICAWTCSKDHMRKPRFVWNIYLNTFCLTGNFASIIFCLVSFKIATKKALQRRKNIYRHWIRKEIFKYMCLVSSYKQ